MNKDKVTSFIAAFLMYGLLYWSDMIGEHSLIEALTFIFVLGLFYRSDK